MADRRSRPRNAHATREEILRQAVRCFASSSYEGVGIRRIAAAAGVDPALVIRYFGSKAALYREAIHEAEIPLNADRLFSRGRAHVGENIALALTSPDVRDSLMLTLRAVTSATAAPVAASHIQEEFATPLAQALGGADSRLRAELIDSMLLGAAIGYWIFEFDSMRGEHAEEFIQLTGQAIQSLIDR